MRLDYALYGLAVGLFAVMVTTFVLVTEQDGRVLFGISFAIVGLLSGISGYFLKPKVVAASASRIATEEPVQKAAEAVEATVNEATKAETPVGKSPVSVPAAIEVPKNVALSEEEANKKSQDIVEAKSEVSAPAAAKVAMELSQIRGINAKRVEQLKANGINSIEDLAKASSSDLAAKLAVSEKIVKMWIGIAKKQTK